MFSKKNFSGKILLFLRVVLCFFGIGCVNHNMNKSITTKNFSLEYSEFKKSESGEFLLGLIDVQLEQKKPMSTELLTLNSTGEISFQRTFVHSTDDVLVADFKLLEPKVYSYFFCKYHEWDNPGDVYFLDEHWNDLVKDSFQTPSSKLNCHDIAVSPRGNYVYLFYKKKASDLYINPELQEINKKGEVVFTWKPLDHIQLPKNIPKNEIDPIHLNSFCFIDEHTLLMSFSNIDEIILLDYPSGQLKEKISKADWKFLNDPYGGFERPHSVQYLSPNKILMFDKGNSEIFKNPRKSRAVEYELDFKNKSAKLVWEYKSDFINGLRDYGGSAQRLSNGNTVIGWGAVEQENYKPTSENPIFTEVSPSGEKIRELKSKQNLISYRVFFNRR